MELQTNRKEGDSFPSFECYCENEKKYQLEFDSGDSGKYVVYYCQICYDQDDKLFLISEEVLS